MMKRAIETSQAECDKSGTCTLSNAFLGAHDELVQITREAVLMALMAGTSPESALLGTGIHIGYRLRQLEEQAAAKAAVN